MAQYIALSGKNGQGKYAIVDDEDYERVMKYKWHVSHAGYPVRKATVSKGKERTLLLHRFIMNMDFGNNLEIDHINRDTLDAQKQNLRICTTAENKRNRSINKNKIVGFKGVHKEGRGWRAVIYFNGKKYNLGTYLLQKDAALAYDRAARKYFGEFACLNFPDINDYQHLNKTSDKKTSQLIGVSKKINRYVSYYKKVYLGSFLTEAEAYNARLEYQKEYE